MPVANINLFNTGGATTHNFTLKGSRSGPIPGNYTSSKKAPSFLSNLKKIGEGFKGAGSLVPLAMRIYGTGISVKGIREAGKRMEVQSEVEALNAEISASEAQEQAFQEERLYRRHVDRLRGTQKARAAMSGLQVEGFNFVDMATLIESSGEIENIRKTGKRAARRSMSQASTLRITGKARRLTAEEDARRTLLSSAYDSFRSI